MSVFFEILFFQLAGADLGFARRGWGANLKVSSANLLFGQLPRKLHENERNWTEGAPVPQHPPAWILQ